jgi:hypothetical protein
MNIKIAVDFFLPGRAKDLSAPLYVSSSLTIQAAGFSKMVGTCLSATPCRCPEHSNIDILRRQNLKSHNTIWHAAVTF